MSKVDIIIMSFVAVIMLGFFWLDTRWSFFGAGICAAVIFAICMGFWIRSLEHGHHNKEWNQFLKTLGKSENHPENTVTDTRL